MKKTDIGKKESCNASKSATNPMNDTDSPHGELEFFNFQFALFGGESPE